MAGSFVQYGSSAAINHALGGFLKSLGVQHLYQLAGSDKARIEQAVWVYLRSIPERSVYEAAVIIRRSAHSLACVKNDLSDVSEWGHERVRKFINGFVIDEPIPAMAMMVALGRDDCRPIPSGGASSLLCHLSLVDWCEGLLGGRQSIRLAARKFLEQESVAVLYACEDWGGETGGCPEACCQCCLTDRCDAILRGLI